MWHFCAEGVLGDAWRAAWMRRHGKLGRVKLRSES
jgi:hypothetical protein